MATAYTARFARSMGTNAACRWTEQTAQLAYGNVTKLGVVYMANRKTTGSNPGQVLTMPVL